MQLTEDIEIVVFIWCFFRVNYVPSLHAKLDFVDQLQPHLVYGTAGFHLIPLGFRGSR